MAHALGVSERVVGLTVVAIEPPCQLPVSLAAAVKKRQEITIANVVGSNIFDLLMILGVTASFDRCRSTLASSRSICG